MSDPSGPIAELRRTWSGLTPRARVVTAGLVAAQVGLAAYLWPFWREQPELSHGYFALPCSCALLWASRREDGWLARPPAWIGQTAALGCLVAGILLGAITALAALAQGPLHSQTAFLAGATAALFLLSGVVALSRTTTAALRLNGASLAALGVWCFSIPLPSGTLSRLTLLLQDFVTAGALRALHVLGYPAIRHGNVIQLANQLVGVEEACSGIRSLNACLFAGAVLGGFMVQGLARRVFVLGAAATIAVLANFVRSTALCVMAASGIKIDGFWHDATAYAVLGTTALILFGGCSLLAPRVSAATPTRGVEHADAGATAPHRTDATGLHLAFSACLAALLALVLVKVSVPAGDGTRVPDLAALLVIDEPGWQRRSDASIAAYGPALNTTHLRQETYFRGDTQLTLYFAFWGAEESTLGSVALHSPDICLPGNGWSPRAVTESAGAYPLPDPRRFAFAKDSDGYPQHVWFWHFFNGQPVRPPAGFYPWQLGPALLKPGVRAKAPQWVLRVSSNKPLESLQGEPLLRALFQRLRAAGLVRAEGAPT